MRARLGRLAPLALLVLAAAACNRGPTRQDYIANQLAEFDSTYSHTVYDSVPTVRDTLNVFRARIAAGEFAPPESLFRTGAGAEHDAFVRSQWEMDNLPGTKLVNEIQAFRDRIDHRFPAAKARADSVVGAQMELDASYAASRARRASEREHDAYTSCLASETDDNVAGGMSQRGARDAAVTGCASKAP